MGALPNLADSRYRNHGLNPIQPIMPRIVPDDAENRNWHWGLIDLAGVYHGSAAAAKARGARRGSHSSSQVPGSASPAGGVPRVNGGGAKGVFGQDGGGAMSSRAFCTNDVRSVSSRADGLGGQGYGGFSQGQQPSSQSANVKSSDDGVGGSGCRGASGGDAFPQQVQAGDVAGADCSWLNEDASDEFSHFLNDIVESEFSLEGASAMAAGAFS